MKYEKPTQIYKQQLTLSINQQERGIHSGFVGPRGNVNIATCVEK